MQVTLGEARRAALSDQFPLYPPAAWFEVPDDLQSGQRASLVTEGPDAGRYVAIVAPYQQCILSGREREECWTAPQSPSNYAGAMQGHTITAEGDAIDTANIGGSVDHADPHRASFTQARDHYANTASQLLRVRYHDVPGVGIVACGAAWPGISDLDIAKIRASPLSGDWRWRQEYDAYDMAGSQLVSTPGFPRMPKAIAYAASINDPHPAIIGGWVGEPEEIGMGEPTLTVTLTAVEAARLQEILAAPSHTAGAGCACGGTGQVAAPPAQAPTQTPPKPVDAPAPNAGGVSRDEFDALVARVEQVEATIMDDQLSDVDAMAAAASLPEPATSAS